MARRITLRQIETFNAMMKAGRVGRAAEMLHVSQPAISKLLAHFEEDSGLELFERLRGRLVPTPAARRLYEEIDRVFSGIQQIEGVVELIRREEKGQLVVGVMPALAGSFLREVLSLFLKECPGVYLTIIARHSEYIHDRIRTRTIDVGLINAHIDNLEVITEPFMERSLVCIMPPGHRLANKPSVHPGDLDGEDFISFVSSNHTSTAVTRSLREQGANPNIVMQSSASLAICELVAAGFGLSLIHPIHLYGMKNPLVVRPFEPEIRLNLLLCRRVDRRQSTLVSAFARAAHLTAERTGYHWTPDS